MSEASRSRMISLVRVLLGHQLVDSEGARCGRADDLLIDDERGELAAIMTGPGSYRSRSRAVGIAVEGVGLDGCTELPWEEGEDYTGTTVKLRRTAAELGLAGAEAKARKLLERLPFS